MHQPTQKQLRKTLKARRNKLTTLQQHLASARLQRQFARQSLPQVTTSYLANKGELNPKLLNRFLMRHGVTVAVPVVQEGYQLAFVKLSPFSQLRLNQHRIPEPRFTPQRKLPNTLLKKVLIPLVGFDQQGYRVGMGGGYYDRWLATFTHLEVIGLAHNCQQARRINANRWDKRLNGVVTPRFSRRFENKR